MAEVKRKDNGLTLQMPSDRELLKKLKQARKDTKEDQASTSVKDIAKVATTGKITKEEIERLIQSAELTSNGMFYVADDGTYFLMWLSSGPSGGRVPEASHIEEALKKDNYTFSSSDHAYVGGGTGGWAQWRFERIKE